jgi:3-hydroxyisobutyrate dehydrogenase-like beta-hydroxyacid dehydrogenase
MNVGFIGIGRMGLPMAHNILAAGFPLTVWNRNADRCAPLAEAGAVVAADLSELAQSVDVVVTMVSDGDAARAILVDGGLLDALRSGVVVLEMSTIGPLAATALAREAATRGVILLDAPISGSIAVAEAGQLFAMVGGDADGYELVGPVLDAMTKGHVHVGRSGAGAAMKLAVNGVIAVTNESIAEALVLAERYGIERETAYDVLAGGAVASPFVLYKRESFLHPETAPVGFTTALMRKDLALALALAADLDVPIPAVEAAEQTLEGATRAGLDAADIARVADVLRAGREMPAGRPTL